MNANQLAHQIRSAIDQLVGWLKWGTAVALAVAVFVLVAERLYSFDVPYLSAVDPQTLAWVAGGYWLSR